MKNLVPAFAQLFTIVVLSTHFYLFDINPWQALPILAAAFGVYIAFQQFRLGKEKFKLDLFDKRFAVVKALIDTIDGIALEENVPPEVFNRLLNARIDSMFLFGPDISNYMVKFQKNLLNLTTTELALMKDLDDVQRERLNATAHSTSEWIIAQRNGIEKLFAPYLKFEVWH